MNLVSLINGFLVGTSNVCSSVIRIANAAGQNKENTRFPSSCGFAVKIRKINEKKKSNSCTALFLWLPTIINNVDQAFFTSVLGQNFVWIFRP